MSIGFRWVCNFFALLSLSFHPLLLLWCHSKEAAVCNYRLLVKPPHMKQIINILLYVKPLFCIAGVLSGYAGWAQTMDRVQVIKNDTAHKVDILINNQLFTSLCYQDSLEKPVLYPVYAANGTLVTRGYPPLPGEPVDHPHHTGIWFNYESVNGLDFWNNSTAIPEEKKSRYGWIKTDKIKQVRSGKEGVLDYHSNWTNQENQVLLEENTRLVFSGNNHQRIIDRVTTLTANTEVFMKDVKDGLLGMRVTRALQMYPQPKSKVAANDTAVIENGNYFSAAGKQGDAVWSSRAAWCLLYGKVGADSVSIAIIDHSKNINYPAFWHARGYGLFAVNPLGEAVFTNGRSTLNLRLQKGESVTFRYRIVIANGNQTLLPEQINQLAGAFEANALLQQPEAKK